MNVPYSSTVPPPASDARTPPLETVDFRLQALALKRMLAQQLQLSEIGRQPAAEAANPLLTPQRLPRLDGARPLRWFHVDVLTVTDDEVHFSGWAFVPEWRPRDTAAFLFLSGHGDFLVPLGRVHRPDVAKAVREQPGVREHAVVSELALSGCTGRFAASNLEGFRGRVHLCLVHAGETAAVCSAESWSCEPAKDSANR